MAKNTNTATVTFNLSNDGLTLDWDFNAKAQERFGKGTGMRHCIGAAYFLASKDERVMMTDFFGKGVVRRGLLVLAKGRNTVDADREKAANLAATLTTLSAVDVVFTAA